MPINSSSIPALRIARNLRRKKRAEGGSVFPEDIKRVHIRSDAPAGADESAMAGRSDNPMWGNVGEAMPESIGSGRILDPIFNVAKSMFWDLPKRAIDQSVQNPQPGLRREDYTDVPPDTTPDPRSAFGGVGVDVPKVGWQPVDPMVGSSLEAASNIMGGTALTAPAAALGAGPVRRAVKAASELDGSEAARQARLIRHHADSHVIEGPSSSKEAGPFVTPKTVYHGRQSDFDAFDPQAMGTTSTTFGSEKTQRHGQFFAEDPDFAASFATQGGRSDPAKKDSSFLLGAGAADKRAAGVSVLDDIDGLLEAEKRLAGAPDVGQAAIAPERAAAAELAAAADAPAVGPGGGGAAGVRSLPEAQGAAARWAGERAPLEGLPGPLKIGEDFFVPGPIGKIHDVAEDFMRTVHPDRPYTPPTKYHPIDPEHSQAIAKAYEEMKHTPSDPATKASYDALIDETAKQYDAIKKTGLKIEPVPAGSPDPYAANPRLAAVDVAENNHLWFFPTESGSPKVPLYAHASGTPETGFQTTGPVGDAHFSRGVGLSDTRKGPTDVQGSFSRAEYQTLQPWWQHDVAGKVGLESVPGQARLWTALGPQTGVDSALGAPKLELLAQQIMVAAKRLRISPERARDLILSGEAGAGMLGGAIAAPVVSGAMRDRERAAGGGVDAAMEIARSIKRAKGGRVHVGPIVGDTGGRADKRPMEVPDGSYVLTADHVSGLGEGNTEAGMKKLGPMFPNSKPSKLRGLKGKAVPIYAADGEFVIHPDDIIDRFGELDYGHRSLDAWQTAERKQLIKTLKNLAPPAQD